jgi:hypothetical protein
MMTKTMIMMTPWPPSLHCLLKTFVPEPMYSYGTTIQRNGKILQRMGDRGQFHRVADIRLGWTSKTMILKTNHDHNNNNVDTVDWYNDNVSVPCPTTKKTITTTPSTPSASLSPSSYLLPSSSAHHQQKGYQQRDNITDEIDDAQLSSIITSSASVSSVVTTRSTTTKTTPTSAKQLNRQKEIDTRSSSSL